MTFSADWLALREQADILARSPGLTTAVAGVLEAGHEHSILDLGAGTGANARYLIERVPNQQRWLLVDHDPALLDRVPDLMSEWAQSRGHRVQRGQGGQTGQRSQGGQGRQGDGLVLHGTHLVCDITTCLLDLSTLDDPALFKGRTLVTAAALLDLVSDRWLQSLAAHCTQSEAAVLFALTYDGRIHCSPEEPEDDEVRVLVNRHQRTNKGFGPALGPDAADRAEEYFGGCGFHVQRERSDWKLGIDAGELGANARELRINARDLQEHLINGWATASEEIAPEKAVAIRDWRARRLRHVHEWRSQLLVGHVDIAAWPA